MLSILLKLGKYCKGNDMRYQFNRFEIDTLKFKLFFAGKAKAIEPKDFDLIVYLIKNRHRAVTREEIFNAVWQGRIVCDSTLSNHIKSIRKILGDNGEEQSLISTIRGRGYQFIATTKELSDKENFIFQSTSRTKLTQKGLIFIFLLMAAILIFFNLNSPEINKNSIAVLPFLNLSGDPDNEYLSDGVSDVILNALSSVEDLHVISHSSSFRFKDAEIDISDVAEQLGVTYVLEGSVRKSETTIRITVQLIEAKNDRQIWGATFTRELDNILAMQTEISTLIVSAVKNALVTNNDNSS
jgi:TolB-like protein/DNA-binding winged helix-turn-helix (wHTH) protein